MRPSADIEQQHRPLAGSSSRPERRATADETSRRQVGSLGNTRAGVFVAVVLLVVGVVLAYANSFSGVSVFDDDGSITENSSIEHLVTAFQPPPKTTVSGRPLLNLSLAINYAIGGSDLWGYHLGNLAIHVCAALALLGIVRRTLLLPTLRERYGAHATELALVIALLWALHPLQTESVTYLIQRAESLMGMLYLLTLYFFLRAIVSPRPEIWFAASVATCVGGMASKEVMVSAPVMVFLFDWIFVSGTFRATWGKRKTYYTALAGTWVLLGYLVLSLGGNRGGTTGGLHGANLALAYWVTQFSALATYLKLSIWPHPLVFEYGTEWVTDILRILPQALVVLTVAVLTLWAVITRPRLGYLGLWFFAILAPTSVVPGTIQMVVEHRMYLALTAVMVGVVIASYRVVGRKGLAVLSAVAVAFGALTYSRNEDYHSEQRLWSDTITKRPHNARAHNILGNVYAAMPGRADDAITEYRASIEADPMFPYAHGNLANALSFFPDKLQEALPHAEIAVRLDPTSAEIRNNYGNVLFKTPGRLVDAIGEYRKAIDLKPAFPEAHLNLGNALLKLPGHEDEAVEQYRAAIRFSRVSSWEQHYNLATALGGMPGHLADAVAEYREALRIRPQSWETHYSLGALLPELPGRLEEAITHDEEALRLKPDLGDAELNLGTALTSLPGRSDDAISHFEAALRIQPDLVNAHFNLGCLLAEMPSRLPEAQHHFEEVLRLKPEDAETEYRLGVLLARTTGTRDAAAAHLEKAISLRRDYVDAKLALAGLQNLLGREGEANAHARAEHRLQLESARPEALLPSPSPVTAKDNF